MKNLLCAAGDVAGDVVKSMRQYLGLGACGLMLWAAPAARADTIYNNSTNDARIRFDPGTLEVGDQIVLAGTARYLTNFSFEYWGTSTAVGKFSGNVEARIRFYMNNGAEYNGYATPGTRFYDSQWFTIQPTERNVLVFCAGDDLDPQGLLLPASEFTWSVQFRGLAEGDRAGVDLYGPLVTGLSYPDYWERKASGWELRAHYATDINFAAVLQASRTPVTSMPRLQIALSDGKAVVSWPAWASNFELLTSPRAAGLPWTVVGSGIFTAGDSYVLTNNVGPGATGWFRLRRLE